MSEGKAEKKKREDPKSRHDKMPRKANLDPIQLPRNPANERIWYQVEPLAGKCVRKED
ncbi:unnamed protein product, partial [Darwinula stevensoni]